MSQIIVLEDDKSAKAAYEALSGRFATDRIVVTEKLSDILGWLKSPPDKIEISELVLDLVLSDPEAISTLPAKLQKSHNENTRVFDGDYPLTWTFVKNWLEPFYRKKHVEIKSRVVLCSAFIEFYARKGLTFDDYRTVQKGENFVDPLYQSIAAMRRERYSKKE